MCPALPRVGRVLGNRRRGRRDRGSYRVTAVAARRHGGLSVGQLVTAACGYAEALSALSPAELAGGLPARALRVAGGRPVLVAARGRRRRPGPDVPVLALVTQHLGGLLAGPDARSPAGVALSALLEDCGVARLRGTAMPPLAEQVATFRARALAVAPPAALPGGAGDDPAERAARLPLPRPRHRVPAVAGLLVAATGVAVAAVAVVSVVVASVGSDGRPDWAAALARVDTCRAAAFGAARADALSACDVPGSAADVADRARVAQLVAGGLHAGPIRQQHSAVRALAPPSATTVRLAATVAADAYDLLDAAGQVAAHHGPASPTSQVVELGRVAPGDPWRLLTSRAG
jgi:hypothetical protein